MVQEGQKRNVYEIAGNKEKEERGRRNWLIIKLREGEKQNDSREGSEMGEKRKQMQGSRVRNTVQAQEGRISGTGSNCRMELE